MKPNRKTCVRWDTPGHAHFLTFSCFRRQPLLNRDRTRNWLVEALNAARQTHNLDIWAYVIMPEHAHVLVFPKTAPYKVSKILATVKLPVTRKALSFVKKEAPAFLNELLDLQPDGSRHMIETSSSPTQLGTPSITSTQTRFAGGYAIKHKNGNGPAQEIIWVFPAPFR